MQTFGSGKQATSAVTLLHSYNEHIVPTNRTSGQKLRENQTEVVMSCVLFFLVSVTSPASLYEK